MTNNEIRQRLNAVAQELGKLELTGRKNWTITLTCITFLEKLSDDLADDEVKTDGCEAEV